MIIFVRGGRIMIMSRHWLPIVFGGLLILAAPGFAANSDEESREKSISLSEVPQQAMEAAQKALGAKPTEAKLVQGTNPQEYELEAKDKSGKEMAVHVLANGTVVKKEKGDKY
jgi:hypothetical protein